MRDETNERILNRHRLEVITVNIFFLIFFGILDCEYFQGSQKLRVCEVSNYSAYAPTKRCLYRMVYWLVFFHAAFLMHFFETVVAIVFSTHFAELQHEERKTYL
jgi:hypothetical protein